MKIDHDRLYKVLTHQLVGRGCGKTFATCCELLNIIELDGP